MVPQGATVDCRFANLESVVLLCLNDPRLSALVVFVALIFKVLAAYR